MTCSVPTRSWLSACVCLALASSGCFEDPIASTTGSSAETGDGDGDPTGDGDGDPSTGDGDGDPSTTGDGDGDPTTGDGDGDPTTGDGDGDGDGDPDPELVVFDFFAMACAAEWISSEDPNLGGVPIECGSEDVGTGAAYTVDELALEDETLGQRVLVVAPWTADTGATTGAFTNIDVSGTTTPLLRTTIACPDAAQSCDFQWQLYARESGAMGLPPVVEDGFESYNGQVTELEIDLSAVKDTPIDVVFVVLANGVGSSDDDGLFVYPRIVDAG